MVMEFFKKGFKTLKFKNKKPSPFGDLEEKIMEILWEKKEATVRQIKDELSKDKENYAYTTIMTIMDRLYKKGILDRRKEGKGYIYFPRVSKEEFEKLVTEKVISDIVKAHPETAIAAFGGVIEELSEDEIKKLKEMIDKKVK